MSEFDHEPVPGLPQKLPTNETLLWQGSPGTAGITRRALHGGFVTVYFAALIVYGFASAWHEGLGLAAEVPAALRLAAGGVLAIGVLALIGWLTHRTTIYTITSRRIVMRFGIALPVTLNLPFSAIRAVDIKRHGDGSGDIAIALAGKERLGFLHLWPHVRPWRLNHPQPTLRALPDAEKAAAILVKAMREAAALDGTLRVGAESARQERKHSYQDQGYQAQAGTPAVA